MAWGWNNDTEGSNESKPYLECVLIDESLFLMDSKRFNMRGMAYDGRRFLSGKEVSVDCDATEDASVNASLTSIGDGRWKMG